MKTLLYSAALVALITASPALAQPAPGAGVGVSPDTGAAAGSNASADAKAGASADGVLAPRSGAPTVGAPDLSPLGKTADPKDPHADHTTITDGKSMARGSDAPAATSNSVNTAATVTVGQKLRTQAGQELGQVVDVQNSPAGEPTRVVVETTDKKRRNVPTAGLKIEHGGVVTSLTAAQIQTLPEAAP